MQANSGGDSLGPGNMPNLFGGDGHAYGTVRCEGNGWGDGECLTPSGDNTSFPSNGDGPT